MEQGSEPAASPFERPLLRAILAGVALLIVAATVILLTRSGSDDAIPLRPDAGAATDVTPIPDRELGALDSAAPIVGQPAPDFALRDRDGAVIRLSDLRGKVVFVNFWASWCVPCRRELPDIQAIYEEMRTSGLEVLAVNYQDDLETAAAFFDERELQLPMVLDYDGEVYEQYRLQGLPDSFFVDRDGNIAALQFGFLTREKMRERLAAAGLP
jgi:peroxiredoxin